MGTEQIVTTMQDLGRYFVEILEYGFEDTGLFDTLADQDRFLPHSMIEYLANDVMLRFIQRKSLPFRTPNNNVMNYGFEIMEYVAETDNLSEKIRASTHGGAFCLFMAGFYPENLERRGMKSEVYVDIASGFYANAFIFQMERNTIANDLFSTISHNTSKVTQSMLAARSSSENFLNWGNDFLELFH